MTVMASLGDICQFVGGGTPARKIRKYWNGDIPWATVKDFGADRISHTAEFITQEGLDNSSSKVVPSGTVLLVTRVGLGKVAITGVDLAINQDIKAVLPSNRILPEFLFWSLNHLGPHIESKGTGATVKGVTLQDVKELEIPLPPLEEQRRIVGILNQAAKIERLRKQAQERLREFIPALFIKMFGDPATNPMGWDVSKLGDLGNIDRGRSRHRPRNAPELYGGPYPFVQTGDIAGSDGVVRHASQRYSEVGLRQSKMWPAGTLCITIAANIGDTGVLAFDACFPDSVVGFIPTDGSATVEYVQCALNSMQASIKADAPMAAQRNINLRILRALRFPVPPVELQRRFGDVVRNARSTAAISETGSTTASALGNSLMFRLITERHVTDIVDTERRSEVMARIRDRDTAPEVAVRRIAHRMGLRFRLHRNELPGRPGTCDLVAAPDDSMTGGSR